MAGSDYELAGKRIWVAGCSTGEETYSLAILFLEEMAAAKRDIKLQVFASDVDPEAVAAEALGDDRLARRVLEKTGTASHGEARMNIEQFMQGYKAAWEAKDGAMFCALFTADGEYHNTPFAVQRGHAQLAEYWRRVKLQEDVHVTYEVLASTAAGGVAQEPLLFGKREIHQSSLQPSAAVVGAHYTHPKVTRQRPLVSPAFAARPCPMPSPASR